MKLRKLEKNPFGIDIRQHIHIIQTSFFLYIITKYDNM